MNRKVYPQGGIGQVTIPSSKSDVHRILVAAALADSSTEVKINGVSKDIEATMSCLKALGSQIIKIAENKWKIIPMNRGDKKEVHLNCGESGSTLRFILPIATVIANNFSVRGEGRLLERPMKDMIKEMEKKGCEFSSLILPFQIKGKLQGGEYHLPGNISSQYITGLLLALPLLRQDSRIVLDSPLESKGYVDMTIATLKLFQVAIEATDYGYFIKGNQNYISPKTVEAEGDWSNAAFFLALGALKGPVTCLGLRSDTKQPDSKVMEILRAFGAEVVVEDGIVVKGGNLKGIEIDASEIPDLIPILSVVASFAQGQTRIFNGERLRYKESDRISAMAEGLNSIGAMVEEKRDGFIINGKSSVTQEPCTAFGHSDHRIVMAMSVAAIAGGKEIIVTDAEAVEKSYPEFFGHLERIGGKSDVI